MDRRTAITTAGAAALTVAAAALAIGANIGLLGSASGDEEVGKATPTREAAAPRKPKVVTVVVDEPAPARSQEVVTVVEEITESADDNGGTLDRDDRVEPGDDRDDDDREDDEDEDEREDEDEHEDEDEDEDEHEGSEDDD